jgi:hypothetical protein
MKNQLFVKIPDKEITDQLLSYFGIDEMKENNSFTKDILIDLKTVEKINEFSETLSSYYLPCKRKYLDNLNEKKTITILRQFLKYQGLTLFSKEKYVHGRKILYYQVIPLQKNKLKNTNKEPIILSFD